jgi:hypothetical protein
MLLTYCENSIVMYFGGETLIRKRHFGRLRRKWKNNIKIDSRGRGFEDIEVLV